jgi:hypothetical protein
MGNLMNWKVVFVLIACSLIIVPSTYAASSKYRDFPWNDMVLKYLPMFLANGTWRFEEICIGGDCRTVWPAAGAGVSKKGDGIYLYNDSTTMFFNETKLNQTIDENLISSTFLAETVVTLAGTFDAGNVTSTWVPRDGFSYNVSENGGAPPVLDIVVNWTGIESFNTILMRVWYEGGLGHEIAIGLWVPDDDEYEEEYGEITDTGGFVFLNIPVSDADVHINQTTGNVSLRFRHEQNGINTHNFYIDYIALVDGISTTTTFEHDALTGRDNIENHPWAFDTAGTRDVTKMNITTDLNVTNNIIVGGDITPTVTNTQSVGGVGKIWNSIYLQKWKDALGGDVMQTAAGSVWTLVDLSPFPGGTYDLGSSTLYFSEIWGSTLYSTFWNSRSTGNPALGISGLRTLAMQNFTAGSSGGVTDSVTDLGAIDALGGFGTPMFNNIYFDGNLSDNVTSVSVAQILQNGSHAELGYLNITGGMNITGGIQSEDKICDSVGCIGDGGVAEAPTSGRAIFRFRAGRMEIQLT